MGMDSGEEDLAQRYNEDGFRQVVGCIPFKFTENGLEILMVSSQSGQNLVLPKGGWEQNESIGQAAAREAQEEAGVEGCVAQDPLGTWIFYKSKKIKDNNPKGACRISIFALEVKHQLSSWPEQHRERQWFNAKQIKQISYDKCRAAWIRESLLKFIEERSSEATTKDVN